jgi:uncharacterized protein
MPDHPSIRMSRWLAVLAVALAVALGASALGYSLSSSTSAPRTRGSIVVDSSASVHGLPNTLTVQLAVTTKAASAAAALNTNDAETHHLELVFEQHGVKSSDLQTQNLNVSPTYNQSGAITGYSAQDSLTAIVHGISRAGSVIAVAENAVGNDVAINGISFSISNSSSLVARARYLAVRQARANAEQFAKAAGESVGAALRITNIQETQPPIPFAFNAAAPSTFRSVPIKPGTSSVSVHVTVTFALIG